jgi:hypothetical protein
MQLDLTAPMLPRDLAIGTLALAETESGRARCVVCRQVKPLCCAEERQGDLINPTCEACCTHRR